MKPARKHSSQPVKETKPSPLPILLTKFQLCGIGDSGQRTELMKATVYIETTIPSLLTAWPSGDLQIAAHSQCHDFQAAVGSLRCAGFHPAGALHAP